MCRFAGDLLFFFLLSSVTWEDKEINIGEEFYVSDKKKWGGGS